jgi:hypothetical protein
VIDRFDRSSSLISLSRFPSPTRGRRCAVGADEGCLRSSTRFFSGRIQPSSGPAGHLLPCSGEGNRVWPSSANLLCTVITDRFPSPTRGRRCAVGADEGCFWSSTQFFSGRIQPSSGPAGHFLPHAGEEKLTWLEHVEHPPLSYGNYQ